MSLLAYYRDTLGFDLTARRPFAAITIGCSQCAAVCINGTSCHERGCPNKTFECRGCSNRVSRQGAYCTDCS